jgi:membrane protease subunit HflK
VTRERIYLETMERLLGGSDKLIYDAGSSQQGAVPLLPLGDLAPRRLAPTGSLGPSPTTTAPSTQQSGGTR